MGKSMEQFLSEKAEIETQLEQEKHKGQRLKNRQSYYESGDRKKRTHHLITRGAAIESIVPEVKPLTEVEFYSMMEHIFSLPETKIAVTFATVKHVKAEKPE